MRGCGRGKVHAEKHLQFLFCFFVFDRTSESVMTRMCNNDESEGAVAREHRSDTLNHHQQCLLSKGDFLFLPMPQWRTASKTQINNHAANRRKVDDSNVNANTTTIVVIITPASSITLEWAVGLFDGQPQRMSTQNRTYIFGFIIEFSSTFESVISLYLIIFLLQGQVIYLNSSETYSWGQAVSPLSCE